MFLFKDRKSNTKNKKKFSVPSFNWTLLICMCLLLTIGVLFIKSATNMRTDSVHYLYVEMLVKWIPLGLIAHFVIAFFDYRKLSDKAWILYALGVFLLLLVLIPGIGTERLGARRWIFGLFQPSEFMKLCIMPVAALLLAKYTGIKDCYRFIATLILFAIPMGLIAIQPDLGSALVFAPVCVGMLFVSGCSPKMLLTLILVSVVVVSIFLALIIVPEHMPEEKRDRIEKITDNFIFPHWKKRVRVFINPDHDPLGAGWNKKQSEIAVGSGGKYGKGYLNGTQNILGFLPRSVSSTDFIFSVVAEEMGFVGSCVLLGLFGGVIISIALTGILCGDDSGRLICVGVATLFFAHIFVNIAMTIGKMPITGIPLPFISYGGTFTISTMALLGLVQSVAIHSKSSQI
ncbi:MAG: rod shape-determining protein RodA [Kiritimatiellae bacterium]|nr:rod shape-determining protein RodA [Kiritimatiellia bacterium]